MWFHLLLYCDRLDSNYFCVHVFWAAFFSFFFFFLVQPQQLTLSTVNSAFVHCSRSHKLHFSATFLFKMGPTALFTHLKIISLQCFQFQFSVSAKISSIQTHPLSVWPELKWGRYYLLLICEVIIIVIINIRVWLIYVLIVYINY